MTDEDKPFRRADLLEFAPNEERQVQAWNRLRQVCMELQLKVPSMMQVRDAESSFSGEMLFAFRTQFDSAGELFGEELERFVICRSEGSDAPIFVQFDAGYRMT